MPFIGAAAGETGSAPGALGTEGTVGARAGEAGPWDGRVTFPTLLDELGVDGKADVAPEGAGCSAF